MINHKKTNNLVVGGTKPDLEVGRYIMYKNSNTRIAQAKQTVQKLSLYCGPAKSTK